MLLFILASVLSACVADSRPDPEFCATPTIELDLTLRVDELVPSNPSACRDQEVTLVVTVEADGVLHVHGYDEAVPATEVRNGYELRLTFDADRSGQFPIELHQLDDPTSINVGILTVHEP
ncbi:hypothetical protein BH23CHL9_BH23CHL9_04160 [soil metagenome]